MRFEMSQIIFSPNLFNAPTAWPTPPDWMKSRLADCLRESIERAGLAISHTPSSQRYNNRAIKDNYNEVMKEMYMTWKTVEKDIDG